MIPAEVLATPTPEPVARDRGWCDEPWWPWVSASSGHRRLLPAARRHDQGRPCRPHRGGRRHPGDSRGLEGEGVHERHSIEQGRSWSSPRLALRLARLGAQAQHPALRLRPVLRDLRPPGQAPVRLLRAAVPLRRAHRRPRRPQGRPRPAGPCSSPVRSPSPARPPPRLSPPWLPNCGTWRRGSGSTPSRSAIAATSPSRCGAPCADRGRRRRAGQGGAAGTGAGRLRAGGRRPGEAPRRAGDVLARRRCGPQARGRSRATQCGSPTCSPASPATASSSRARQQSTAAAGSSMAGRDGSTFPVRSAVSCAGPRSWSSAMPSMPHSPMWAPADPRRQERPVVSR